MLSSVDLKVSLNVLFDTSNYTNFEPYKIISDHSQAVSIRATRGSLFSHKNHSSTSMYQSAHLRKELCMKFIGIS